MEFLKAIRGDRAIRLAIVGAGGKTSAMFRLAREFEPPVLVTTSTHLSISQTRFSDTHIIVKATGSSLKQLVQKFSGVTLVTGPEIYNNRVQGLNEIHLQELREIADDQNIPVLIEADGSRQLPLKAPAAHEPAIPPWVNSVIVVAGLSGLWKSLGSDTVHRPEIFSELSGVALGEKITSEGLGNFLIHASGGQKNIPIGSRKILLLNQADLVENRADAKRIVELAINSYDSILIASLKKGSKLYPVEEIAPYSAPVYAVYEPTAAIILAAGESRRFGKPKAMLDWKGKPFIRHITETALLAGLNPIILVLGAVVEPVAKSLNDLPIQIVKNEEWQHGQSTSIRSGISALMNFTGSAIFMLCDQPQVSVDLLESLIETHQGTLSKIVCPQVEGKRATPVLFDRDTYRDLMTLQGDTGGRALFSKFPITWLPWHDASISLDVDTPDDYQKLLEQ
jgi:molybdenum cofactor cytidylyltransferase